MSASPHKLRKSAAKAEAKRQERQRQEAEAAKAALREAITSAAAEAPSTPMAAAFLAAVVA